MEVPTSGSITCNDDTNSAFASGAGTALDSLVRLSGSCLCCFPPAAPCLESARLWLVKEKIEAALYDDKALEY